MRNTEKIMKQNSLTSEIIMKFGWRVAVLVLCGVLICKIGVPVTGIIGGYITTCEGFQVVRAIMIGCMTKVGELPTYTHSEVMQRWIAPNGKYCTFARLRQTMGTMYYDSWLFHTPLELRQENEIYNRIFTGVVYPKQKLNPELKRTGYKKSFYGQKPRKKLNYQTPSKIFYASLN